MFKSEAILLLILFAFYDTDFQIAVCHAVPMKRSSIRIGPASPRGRSPVACENEYNRVRFTRFEGHVRGARARVSGTRARNRPSVIFFCGWFVGSKVFPLCILSIVLPRAIGLDHEERRDSRGRWRVGMLRNETHLRSRDDLIRFSRANFVSLLLR